MLFFATELFLAFRFVHFRCSDFSEFDTKCSHPHSGKDGDVVKLYDLTTKYSDVKSDNPFTVPLGILLYRVARSMHEAGRKNRKTIRGLLENSLSLLDSTIHSQVCSFVWENEQSSAEQVNISLVVKEETTNRMTHFSQKKKKNFNEEMFLSCGSWRRRRTIFYRMCTSPTTSTLSRNFVRAAAAMSPTSKTRW